MAVIQPGSFPARFLGHDIASLVLCVVPMSWSAGHAAGGGNLSIFHKRSFRAISCFRPHRVGLHGIAWRGPGKAVHYTSIRTFFPTPAGHGGTGRSRGRQPQWQAVAVNCPRP